MTVMGGQNFKVLRQRCHECGTLVLTPLPVTHDVYCENCGAEIDIPDEYGKV